MLAKIKTLMLEYGGIYAKAWENTNFKHPIAAMVRNDIAQEFRTIEFLDSNIYMVKASCGTGRFTTVPWVAIFDQRITDSAQKGVYIVYLLNKDTCEFYLTLNQAATGSTITELKERAKTIQKKLEIEDCEPIYTGSEAYDAGCILSKKYTVESLNDKTDFLLDLKYFIEKYKQYYSLVTSVWWPSKNEYDPGISKEMWLHLLKETDVLGDNIRRMFAAMYAEGGAASCAQLAEKYGKNAGHYIMTAVHAAERASKATGCPLMAGNQDSKFWPVLFVGRSEEKKDRYIWKIRDELYEALSEYDIERYLIEHNVKKIDTFDSWKIIDEVTAIKYCDKSFFDHRGSDVPKGICWFFSAEEMELGEIKAVNLIYNGKEFRGSIKNESSDRQRVRIFWNTELGKLFDAFNVPDAEATFVKITDDTYEVSIKGGEKEMTIKEKVVEIKSYIAARGFYYEGDLIDNFYLSLKSKPFVILAGTSGTGKTRLVKLFAEAIGAKMKLVSVRPDWSDSSDLFGYTDLSGNFHPGAIIDFIKQAEEDKSKPHFLCLDEMNLARVEYYLSDFLSIIETRDRKENGTIETDDIVDTAYFQSEEAREKYGRVYIPENLYIIGTVNMDETTFPFSKKVLDRANTIEFSFVNLMAKAAAGGQVVAQKLDNSFLKTDYLYLRDCDDEELIDSICFSLEELNHILMKANLHVGYRVRDEISFYMMNNKNADLLTIDVAFDHEIMQKILPRIQGSSAAIKDVLSQLFIKCAGDYIGFSGVAEYEQMNAYLDSKTAKYTNSAKKIAFMMRRYEEDGFTSYWL